MACSVSRNQDGTITKVLNQEGKESKLFPTIASHIAISDSEIALEVYKNVYVDKFKDVSENDMQFIHKVNGENFISFREALKSAKENTQIGIGILVDDNFTELLTVSKNTDLSNEIGFIQSGILNNLIAEERLKVGNEYKLQVEGKDIFKKQVNMAVLRDSSSVNLGSQAMKVDSNVFTLKKTIGVISLYDKQGDKKEVLQKDFDEMSNQEVLSNFDNGEEIVADRMYREEYIAKRELPNLQPSQIKGNEELVKNLVKLLKNMGISTVSMTNYITNYTLRNGVNPDSEALADIANQVIGISSGNETVENLTEETVHFIVEALPQTRIENILRNIDKSEEYKQHYTIQKAIYESEYSGEELENVVRREILGKIIVNAILQTEQKSDTQQNFFENAKRLISEFFQDIINYFKPEYQIELDNLINDVQNLIITQDVSNLELDNFKGNIMRLYSVIPTASDEAKLYKSTKNLITSLTEQEKSLRGTTIKNLQSLNRLEQIQSELNETVQVNSVAGLVVVAKARIAELKATIKESKNKGSLTITAEEKIIFDSLVKKIQPELSAIKALIKDNKSGKNWKALIESIDVVVLDIIDLSAETETIDNQNTERLVDKIVNTLGIQNSSTIKDWLKVVKKDTNMLLSTFGQLSAARDGMLNLIGILTKNMTNEGRSKFVSRSKALQKIMSDNSVTAEDFAKLVDRGFIISNYDFPKFRSEMDAMFLQKYKEYSKTTLKDEEILELRRNKELETFGDRQMQYERELKQLQDSLKERAFKDEYYLTYEKRMLEAGVSKATKDYLSGYFSGLADIKLKSTKVVNNKIVTDYSLLSLADRERQKELQQDRRATKSYIDSSGNLKTGISIKQEDGVNVLDDKGKIIYELGENPSTEAIVAYELNKLDSLNDYSGMDMKNGIPKKFLDELKNIETVFGNEEAIDFLRMNSHIGFKSEFWDGLGKSKKITEKLRESLTKDVNTEEIKSLINNIESKNLTIKSILRVFVNKNSPIEVDSDRIPSDAKNRIKSLQEDLETDFRNAKKYIKDISENDSENSEIFEEGVSTTNEAWRNLLIDSGLSVESFIPNPLYNAEEILKIVKEHTTSNNRDAIDGANISIRQFRNGSSVSVNESVKKELQRQGLNKEDLIDDVIYAKFITTYAENKLLPYYKRFAPISYDTFNEDMQNTEDISDFVTNISLNYPSLEIIPNPSYFEVQDNEQINPNFNTNFKGGYAQPNSRKFRNEAFYDLFGDDKGTKNPKLFTVYNAMMDYRIETLEANSAGKGYNAYMLPQTRKGGIEKFSNFLKSNPTQNAKNAIQDMFNFTEDEQVKGDVNYTNMIKTIPQMYLSEIEPSDVSTELFYSLMLSGKESFMRESRVKYYGDVISTLDTMQKRDYSATGKTADATQTMKMAKSAVDYSLFGVKETSTLPIKTPFGEVDGAKIARNLLGYVKLKNLGLNVVIPFTSLATAKLNIWTESYIGQYLHKRSHKLGQAEYGRKWKDGMKEFGKVDTKADINVYGQHFGSFDLDESFRNSNYNIFGRTMVRTPMGLHAMANYPIYGANMYSILHDYRFVDGKLQNFNQYRQAQKLKNIEKKDIENSWNALEDKVIYKYTKNTGGKFSYDEKAISEEIGVSGEELVKEIESFNNMITNQISAVNTFIDGSISQEEKTYAQRDAYLSYLTTHKGWLTIATQRRFKSRHINLETGQEEEGSYNSFWNFLGDYIKEYKDSGLSGMIVNFKRAYEKADDTQRANIIRVGKEMLVLNSIIALLMILKNFADDDDNKDVYSLQLATYLLYRISAETTSSSLGLGSNYTEALKNPLIGFDTIANLGNVVDLLPYVGGDEVTRGKYSGMTERAKFLTTSFPGAKGVFDLYNINSTRNTYELYNESNLDYTIGSVVLWSESEEKNNEE